MATLRMCNISHKKTTKSLQHCTHHIRVIVMQCLWEVYLQHVCMIFTMLPHCIYIYKACTRRGYTPLHICHIFFCWLFFVLAKYYVTAQGKVYPPGVDIAYNTRFKHPVCYSLLPHYTCHTECTRVTVHVTFTYCMCQYLELNTHRGSFYIIYLHGINGTQSCVDSIHLSGKCSYRI